MQCRRSTGQAGPKRDAAGDDTVPATPVCEESEWRVPPSPFSMTDDRHLRIRLSRWRNTRCHGITEVSSDGEDPSHVLTVLLRQAKAEMMAGGKVVGTGGKRGAMLMTGPRHGRWRAVQYGKYDAFRVFFP